MKKLSLAIVAIAGFVSVANAALADGGAKFLGNITTGGQIRSDFAQYCFFDTFYIMYSIMRDVSHRRKS